MSQRILKINSLMKRELSLIIQQELKDPRIGFVTVTGVEVSNDLRHARVYCSVMGDQAKKDAAMEGLNSAKGFIQMEMSARIKLRYMPELSFKLDTSLDYSMHIEEVLKKIREEKPQDAKEEE